MTHLLCAAMLAFSACIPAIAAEPAEAHLTVETEVAGPRIEPEIYGHFVEHLGTGVYGGLWVGPESEIPNTRGWRNDLIEALRRIGVPVIRWPGGCFADDYDWRDGIGDPATRPVRLNRWWGRVPESNRVGTHEFMDLVELLDSEAYIAANMGSMSPMDTSRWLEYMTSDSDSALAGERRRNGRERPWRVKYVGVGNESWGCGGNMRPEYQADLHNRYATYLQDTLRVASGDGQQDDHLVEVLMERSGSHMDAFTLHYYTIAGEWQDKGPATGFGVDRWAKGLESALGIEERIVAVSNIMDKHDPDKRIALYVDEWGTWHDPAPGSNPGFLQQQNTLRDAMVAAVSFNAFHRHTERVKMANIAQMVNVLQAMALTDGRRMTLTPTYHVFDMYKPFRGATPLQATLETPRWQEGEADLPAVDASVARTADGRTVLALVNLDPRRPARVSTNLSGTVEGRLLTADAIDAHNTFARPDALVPTPYRAGRDGAPLTLELPAKSIVVVDMPR